MNDYIQRVESVIAGMQAEGWTVPRYYENTDEAKEFRDELCDRLCKSHPDGPLCHCPSCGRRRRMYEQCVCGTVEMKFEENYAD